MKGLLLLCDHAQEVGGKLYILGGGWSMLRRPDPPNIAVAIKLEMDPPAGDDDGDHVVRLELVRADGTPVMTSEDKEVVVQAQVHIGAQPAEAAGRPPDVALAVNMAGLTFEPGDYEFRLRVDGTAVSNATFRVLPLGLGLSDGATEGGSGTDEQAAGASRA